MFASIKEKISDAVWSLSSDDTDKALADLVARGTSETLIAPEWGVNMALVDMVNQNPAIVAEKLLKVLKRAVTKPNAKTQILTLTILETCVKNGVPALYAALAQSELWLELVKMSADTSVSRVDADVRDKILCLVEDYAKVLPQQEFREAYEYLLEQGIDFPVRGPDDQAPILTPPSAYQPPTVVPAGAAPHASPAVAAAMAAGLPGARGGEGEGADPFAGMSEEDRAAIQAAMAEMEAEDRVVRESAAMAASTALFQQMNQQGQQQGQGQQGQGQGQGHAYGAHPGERGSRGATPPVREEAESAVAALPDNPEEALEAISNATGLLNEMLGSGTDPREQFVVELAEQCVRFQSKLEDIINSLTDETQLASALTHHEALQAAITKYDEHLSRAEQGAQPAARPGDQDAGLAAFAAAASANTTATTAGAYAPPSFLPPPTATAGPNFTLLGEDDEEDRQDSLLSSKRGAAPAAPAEPAATVAPAAAAAVPVPVAAAVGSSLIDLLDAPQPGPTIATAAPAPTPAPAPAPAPAPLEAPPSSASAQQQQLDSLLDGLTVHDASPSPAATPASEGAALTTPAAAAEAVPAAPAAAAQ